MNTGEWPEFRKFTHEAVGYEDKSTHDGERCGNCEYFIAAKKARCEHVKGPILRPGWCRRYEKEGEQ